jgi:branched-chain amino acid transport system substrate-binding protein
VPALDNPENAAFLSLFQDQIGGEAGVYVEESYTAAEVAARAIEAVGGDLSDGAAFMDAVRSLAFDSVAGPFSFDESGQSVRNVYITRVAMTAEGVPSQEVIHTVEDVSLNWMPEQESQASGSTETVRIGVLNPTTGSLAANGEDVNTGIRLYFDSINNTVNGTPIELVFADTAANPDQALEQARRLIEQEQVDFLLGIVSSSVVVPVAQLADEQQIPLIVAVAGGAPAITGPDRSPYVFRTGITTGQQEPPFAWYVANELGYSRAAMFAWDFAAGHARAETFKETFLSAGGEVLYELWPPVGTTDFGPFIGQFNPDDVDFVYAYFAGPGAIAFVNQMQEFGITPTTPIVGPGFLTEFEVLPGMGASADGIVSATHYTPVVTNPANEEFIAHFQAMRGDNSLPGTYVEAGYLASLVAAEAIEAVGGDLSDNQRFLDALQALEVEGPSGAFRFDERGQGVRDLYIIEVVVNEDGSVTHQVVDVVSEVSQDWTPPQ